jgi:SAM-dependent methyltransferase
MKNNQESLGNFGERTIPAQDNLWEFKRIYQLTSMLMSNRNSTVLDYGCGSGYGTSLLKQFYSKVIGVDVSPEAISFCKNTYKSDGLDFVLINNGNLPFGSEKFDLITSFQVFEHVPDEYAENYLKNIFDKLRPGGCAIITTPNGNNYVGGHSGNPYHIHEYTLDELEMVVGNAVGKSNFEIYAFWDVPTNVTHLYLQKLFGQKHVGASFLSKLVSYSLKIPRVLEKILLSKKDSVTYLEKRPNKNVWGSHFVLISKRS